jgi:hypothetical protein
MPRLPRAAVQRAIETAEQEVAKPEPRRILEVDGKQVAEPLRIETVDKVIDPEWAAQMQFNEDKITFVVNDDTNPTAENPVLCQCNGENAPVTPRPGWLYRGVEYTIARKFLASILRAKIVTYKQKEETDPNGVRHVLNIPHIAPRYQVRVIADPHIRGTDWLKHIMLEAP